MRSARYRRKEKDRGGKDMTEEESLVEGLRSIKDYSEVELKAQGKDSGQAEFFISDAETMDRAITLIENPTTMRFMEKEEVDSLLNKLKDLEEYSKDMEQGSEEMGIDDSAWGEDIATLDSARNLISVKYHVYQTEILDVQRSEETGDDYGMVHFRQGRLSGYGLVPMELLDEEYEGKETEDKAIVQDLIKQGELELPDLCKLPGNCDISPTLLNFYDDIRQEPPGRIGYTEEDLKALADSERFKWKGYQAIRDEIEADLILYPSLRGSINLDPVDEIGDLKYGIEFENDFRTCIADDYPSARYVKMAAIFHDMPGEEIFEKIEESLRIVAKMDTQRTLKEAMTQFVALSGQDVLVSLKHEAEAKDVRKGSTVLYGTMKFETQKDRQEAYKWVKKWLNKPIKELCHEISTTQEKDKSQGR